jgi:hypothetical protein
MTSQPIPTSIDLPEKKRRNGRFWRIVLIIVGAWAAVTAVSSLHSQNFAGHLQGWVWFLC